MTDQGILNRKQNTDKLDLKQIEREFVKSKFVKYLEWKDQYERKKITLGISTYDTEGDELFKNLHILSEAKGSMKKIAVYAYFA